MPSAPSRIGKSRKAPQKQRGDVVLKGPQEQPAEKGSGKAAVSRRARLGEPSVDRKGDHGLVIVGIGASAGGLEAVTELLEHLPERTGMALVLVQHLDPHHQSLLSELLGRRTKLPVREASEDTRVLPDRVYVIPPNKNMTLEKGALRLAARTLHRGQHMPVDIFLRSLAADRGNRAVGVILSGANTDGALGIEAIKAEGGITLAQEPESAKHGDMPAAAIGTGCVDFVLPPAAIARELARIDQHPYVRAGPAPPEVHDVDVAPEPVEKAEQPPPKLAQPVDAQGGKGSRQELQRILLLLRNSVGVDFSQYKPATVQRRIQRRMALLRMEKLEDYAQFLRSNEAEILALYQDILIKVTSFFRDSAVFDYLKHRILPRMFKGRNKDDMLRIWVPGCSSGEEAYSIAICVAEYLGRRRIDWPVQIFATDLSEGGLDRAREGTYIENIALDVSAERLRRFFTRDGRSYRIIKPIREMVIFARQNLAKDPPFSRLDLVSCRNVLIYLSPALQKRVFPIFHYSLRPGGFLLLGNSESVGEFTDLFGQVDKRARVFVRKNAVGRAWFEPPGAWLLAEEPEREIIRLATAGPPPSRAALSDRSDETAGVPSLDVQREVNRILLQRYTPAGVVVNEDLEIIQFHGQGHNYFEPAPGRASFNLLKLMKPGLAAHARTVLAAARKDQRVVRRHASYSDRERVHEVELEVVPLKVPRESAGYFLLLLHEISVAPGQSRSGGAEAKISSVTGRRLETREIGKLQQELSATRQYLQSIIEEQDASNEEIKSANEEILSSNEELQSTNEELETAKEELQSSNEELVTVNEELQNRNAELGLANNDLINLINSINFAIVMLGQDGKIRRFTPAAARLFNLIPTDVGRPFNDIKPNLRIPDLDVMVAEVVDSMNTKELEVEDAEGWWYHMNIRPYRTADHKIDGTVLGLVDVDALKRSLEEIKESRDFSEAVVATIREPLLVLDSTMRVKSANTAFYEKFRTTREATTGQLLDALGNGEWNIPGLNKLLTDVLERGSRFENFGVENDFRELGHKRVLLNGRRIDAVNHRPPSLLLTIEDTTERRQVEQEILAISEREQRRMAQDLHDGLGQQLTGIAFMIQGLLNELDREVNPALVEKVEQLLTQFNQAAALTRELARGLHPLQLQAGHFRTAMLGLANNVESLFKVSCTFHADDPCRPPDDSDEAATHLFRITQEAINNALKHGKAKRISVTYTQDSQTGRSILSISDDGSGIRNVPRPDVVTKGMGLQIMRYRAEAVGGKLTIERGANGGTVVSVSIRNGSRRNKVTGSEATTGNRG